MEERTKMLRQINAKKYTNNVTSNNDLNVNRQTNNIRPLSPLASPERKSPTTTENASLADAEHENKSLDNDDENSGSERKSEVSSNTPNENESVQRVAFNSTADGAGEGKEKEKDKRLKALDRKKVHKMHGAIRLNEVILEHSSESQLVLFSLPRPPIVKEGVDDYIHYLEVISDKLKRVLFVRGTGGEVITTSS
uniref:SLC12A transporter C-terminal domain-containing protein n=1 Tax=Ditylenchus dipsaci TaxID=166011 RepID=A0A915DCH1_9BILA